jgi:hypothetical protein
MGIFSRLETTTGDSGTFGSQPIESIGSGEAYQERKEEGSKLDHLVLELGNGIMHACEFVRRIILSSNFDKSGLVGVLDPHLRCLSIFCIPNPSIKPKRCEFMYTAI